MIHAPLIFEPAVAMSELLTEAAVPLASVAAVLRGYAEGQTLQAGEVDLLFDIIVMASVRRLAAAPRGEARASLAR